MAIKANDLVSYHYEIGNTLGNGSFTASSIDLGNEQLLK